MKLLLRQKIILGAVGMVITVILVSTVSVSLIISRQNRNGSYTLIDRSFAILIDELRKRNDKLVSDVKQIAVVDEMGAKVKSVKDTEKEMYSYIKVTYRKIASILSNSLSTSLAKKIVIYSSDGDLIASIIRMTDSVRVEFVHKGVSAEMAIVGSSDKLSESNWQSHDGKYAFPLKFQGFLPERENTSFAIADKNVCIVAQIPVTGQIFNSQTNAMESKQVGLVIAIQPLDDSFINPVSKTTGTKLNIFTGSTIAAGNIPEYNEFENNAIPHQDQNWSLNNPRITRNDLSINNHRYFQGILPVYEKSELICTITSLISKEVSEANTFQIIKILLILALFCILLIVPAVLIFSNTLIRPIREVVTGFSDIAKGDADLTKRLSVRASDEIGELANWFNIFITKLQEMIRRIGDNTIHINTSSTTLARIATELSSNAELMDAKSTSATTTSIEMSSSIDRVASAMDNASSNIQMISVAAEEITSTIREIAKNCELARVTTIDSVNQVQVASQVMRELMDDVMKIGQVTETIYDISDNINILALNATIEASRAGESGRGFAVVAEEVKLLAKQTADAMKDIENKTKRIQLSTTTAVSKIDHIQKVMNDVSDYVTSIATAVEEQSSTMHDISKNVNQASNNITEINRDVADNNTMASKIHTEISQVNESTKTINKNSGEVDASATELNGKAEELNEMVGKFKVV